MCVLIADSRVTFQSCFTSTLSYIQDKALEQAPAQCSSIAAQHVTGRHYCQLARGLKLALQAPHDLESGLS